MVVDEENNGGCEVWEALPSFDSLTIFFGFDNPVLDDPIYDSDNIVLVVVDDVIGSKESIEGQIDNVMIVDDVKESTMVVVRRREQYNSYNFQDMQLMNFRSA